MLAAVSSRLAVWLAARLASPVLSSAIWADDSPMACAEPRIAPTMLRRLVSISCNAAISWPISSWLPTSTTSVRSPLAMSRATTVAWARRREIIRASVPKANSTTHSRAPTPMAVLRTSAQNCASTSST